MDIVHQIHVNDIFGQNEVQLQTIKSAAVKIVCHITRHSIRCMLHTVKQILVLLQKPDYISYVGF